MHRFLTMKRLSALFFLVFAVSIGGMFAYQAVWKAPGERCEAGGRWWDPEHRICAQPISIAEITGRPEDKLGAFEGAVKTAPASERESLIKMWFAKHPRDA